MKTVTLAQKSENLLSIRLWSKAAVFPDVCEQVSAAQYSRQHSNDTHSDDHRRITDRDLQTHSTIILNETQAKDKKS